MQAGTRKKVLIVEDDDAIRQILAELLKAEGYAVVTANDGQRALEALADPVRPQLIIVDLMMPVMDGREFLLRKAQIREVATVPVIVVTAMAGGQELAPPGANVLIKKPLDIEPFLIIVKKWSNDNGGQLI